jgi:putative endonuclease
MAYSVYILTNPASTVLYTGVTTNLAGRVFAHKEKLLDGFTKRYPTSTRLVYYEMFEISSRPASGNARSSTVRGARRWRSSTL